jgi:hypothetical protein
MLLAMDIVSVARIICRYKEFLSMTLSVSVSSETTAKIVLSHLCKVDFFKNLSSISSL